MNKLNLKKHKILLTGGHAGTTALAVIEEIILQSKNHNHDIYWIGVKHAIEGKRTETLEHKLFSKLNVSYKTIRSGRFQRRWSIHTIPSLVKIPFGFLQAFYFVATIRPSVTISFGGFAALPVVFWSWVFQIPVIIHEQTVAAGLANKLSVPFARRILLARESSLEYFPKEKSVVVGNPVMALVREVVVKKKMGRQPVILITGGSRGSQRMNVVIDEVLETLLKKYKIIHLTGDLDYEHFKSRKDNLDEVFSKNYEVYAFIDPLEISKYYKVSDMVIGRAGANTVSEIIVTRRPAVIIPIPWTRYDEQTKNAEFAENLGIAKMLTEERLTSQSLEETIAEIIRNYTKMVARADKKIGQIDTLAASKVVGVIEEVL